MILYFLQGIIFGRVVHFLKQTEPAEEESLECQGHTIYSGTKNRFLNYLKEFSNRPNKLAEKLLLLIIHCCQHGWQIKKVQLIFFNIPLTYFSFSFETVRYLRGMEILVLL